MEPPPPPSQNQFLKPQAPVRPRTSANASTNDSLQASSSNANIDGATDVELSQEDSNGIVYYSKPDITASQIMPTQATQKVDILDEEIEEATPVVAFLRGFGSTMSVDLTLEKRAYHFGTSNSCDVIIGHRHWTTIIGRSAIMTEPWFTIHIVSVFDILTPRPEVRRSLKSSPHEVTLNDKKLPIHEAKDLNWGNVICAKYKDKELFRYSFMNKEVAYNGGPVQGEKSEYSLNHHALASGAYAQVFKAVDNRNGEVYACKVLEVAKREFSAQDKENIAYEIGLLRTLNHKNVVKFVDVSQGSGKIYIFTELIDGQTLGDYCGLCNNYLSEVDARHIFVQACEAVQYLHSMDIVHRDIKSENVMVTKKNVVKLIDFGLARSCSSSQALLTTYCGTPAFMAPEAFLGQETNGYGKGVDIWALGILLFRMLVGTYPFSHRALEENEYSELPQEEKKVPESLQENENSELPREEKSNLPDLSEMDKKDPEKELRGFDMYKRDWQKYVNKKAIRSLEDRMLATDPTRRLDIDYVLRHDWCRMMEEELEKFDVVDRKSNVILKDAAVVQEEPAPYNVDRWGELRIANGCIPSATRSITLDKDMIWLGRDKDRVNAYLGPHHNISMVHCLIRRLEDGTVMVSNASRLIGTCVNHMKIDDGCSVQIFDGDELGIVVPPETRDIERVFPTTNEDLAKRRVEKYQHVVPEPKGPARIQARSDRKNKNRPPPPNPEFIWGTLIPLNSETKREELTKLQTSIGRSEECDIVVMNPVVSRSHCVISWEENNNRAYLSSIGINGTTVNGVSSLGPHYQLRHGDIICLTDKKIGYKIELPKTLPKPSQKRHKKDHDQRSSSTASEPERSRSKSVDTEEGTPYLESRSDTDV
ncbi:hypothetical protein BGZ49_002602 [Haplosporangium sp. Z 27]|nr:hypothetical protein BGZ49_002602 [Haplosporangium sp. Z 27]